MIKTFPAQLNNLYEMLDFIRKEAEQTGFDPMYLNKIELATEEVLVNIISYSYPQGQGQIVIQCSCTKNFNIEIKIRDEGIPYNPLTAEKACDSNAPLEEKTVGGYGIFFIRNLMDEVIYSREENVNVLTLKKFLPKPQPVT